MYNPADGLGEELIEDEGLEEAEGDKLLETLGEVEAEGETDFDGELLGLAEALPLRLGETDALGETDGDTEWLTPNKPSSSRACPLESVSVVFLISRLLVNLAEPRGPLSLKELIPPIHELI